MIIHNHKCTVTIEGLPPGILLHNPASMGASKKAAKVIPSPEDEAAAACYWNDDKTSLVFPAINFRGGLIQASSGCKSLVNRKLALSPLIAGDVEIVPFLIPFNTTEYKVDVRRVVVQRNGVMRARPLVFPWRLEFTLSWEPQYLGENFHESILPDLLERLGKTIGLGDYRPARKGPFGRFVVVGIERA